MTTRIHEEFIHTQLQRHVGISPSTVRPHHNLRTDLHIEESQLENICLEIAENYPDAFEGDDYLANDLYVRDLYRLVEQGGYPARIHVQHQLELNREYRYGIFSDDPNPDPPTYILNLVGFGDRGFVAHEPCGDHWIAVAWLNNGPPTHVDGLDTINDVVHWLRNLPEEEE